MEVFLTLFAWPGGILVGNLLASLFLYVLGYLLILRKFECKEKGCYRFGRHIVPGTTYHTCAKHYTIPVHDKLRAQHASERPAQHATIRHNAGVAQGTERGPSKS